MPLGAPEAPSALRSRTEGREGLRQGRLVARTKVVKDAGSGAELKSFVQATGPQSLGHNVCPIHRMMSLAANTLAIPLDDAKYLIDRMLEKLDCEPEGREHWRGVACSSHERGLEYRKQQQELEATLQVARSIRAPGPTSVQATGKGATDEDRRDGAVVYLSTGWNLYLILARFTLFRLAVQRRVTGS